MKIISKSALTVTVSMDGTSIKCFHKGPSEQVPLYKFTLIHIGRSKSLYKNNWTSHSVQKPFLRKQFYK